MTPDLDIDVESGVVVARLVGEVDLGDTATVRARVLAAVSNDAVGLVVDLSATRYLDSAAIQMLFEFTRQLEAGRQAIAIVVPAGSALRSLVEITGLHQAAAICPSRADAVAAVLGGAGRRY